MSYYTTGSSFSLKTGTHLPRVIYNNNGITSGRTSGVIAPSDPQTNGPASTSVFMEASINSNGTLNAERLAEEFADKIEPHLSSVGSISTPHLSTSMLFLGLQAMSLPNFIRVAAYNGGYIASDASSFYINSSGPSGSVSVFDDSAFIGFKGATGPLINSIDCSSNGTKIVGINYVNKELYLSTDSGKTFKTQNIGTGSYIQVRMTSDGYFFSILDYDGHVYLYNITDMSIKTILFSGGVPKSLKCLSISSDGGKQFVFTSQGTINIINVNVGIVTLLTPISISPSVEWDSCACSYDGNTQIAVGFVKNGSNYDCYVFLTKNMWTNYTYTKITRRAPTKDVNYAKESASGTTSFMSSNGSKKWCIIDDQLYYSNTDNANDFSLVLNLSPDPNNYFIRYGTCGAGGSVLYLIRNDGSLWRSFDNGTMEIL
jgi:hypothetical protein